ncbi:hypothetical protein SAMN04489724_3502 [Algoriphagus locisalis]|uniref:Uncharacterized protein n=1 Tax=Algoriphagus locisalis TaxID=305507 RepID=A0A1I7CW21_9BACT|nr:hypothetical protein SAMN04489724_3502 [Algoriphagus locisalis]
MISIVPLNRNNKPIGYPDGKCSPNYPTKRRISRPAVTQKLEPIQTNY